MTHQSASRTVLAVLLPLALLVGACSSQPQCRPGGPPIQAQNPWVRAVKVEPTPTPAADGTPADPASYSRGSTAAYLTLQNCAGALDHLTSVESDAAEIVELHKTETRNGMTMMAEVQNMELPAGKSIALQPGGLHIMLIRMNRSLAPGDQVRLKLVFDQAAPLEVTAEVKAP